MKAHAQPPTGRGDGTAAVASSAVVVGHKRPLAEVAPTPVPPPGPGSKPSSAVPVGFFDDAIADACAQAVDLQQVAAQQLASDWEQFQEFVAEVEEREAQEQETQADEQLEREAVESLDNMAYVDRYRRALERAAGHAPPPATTTENHDDDTVSVIRSLRVATAKRRCVQAPTSDDRGSSDDDFDPTDWRSKGL